MHARKLSTPRTALHGDYSDYSAPLIPVKTTHAEEHRAANDESATPAPEHMVNPLWMITVGLGLFVALILLMVTFD